MVDGYGVTYLLACRHQSSVELKVIGKGLKPRRVAGTNTMILCWMDKTAL